MTKEDRQDIYNPKRHYKQRFRQLDAFSRAMGVRKLQTISITRAITVSEKTFDYSEELQTFAESTTASVLTATATATAAAAAAAATTTTTTTTAIISKRLDLLYGRS
jgi:hypothetical protein